MTYLIVAVAILGLTEVLTLTLLGKRAHKEKEPKRVYSEHFPWEEDRIAYNRMHGLPDDAI